MKSNSKSRQKRRRQSPGTLVSHHSCSHICGLPFKLTFVFFLSLRKDDIFGDDDDDIFETKKKPKQPEKTAVDNDPLNMF